MASEVFLATLRTGSTVFFLVVGIFFIGMTFILEYHWRRYTTHSRLFDIARIFYYGLSLIFLLVMIRGYVGLL